MDIKEQNKAMAKLSYLLRKEKQLMKLDNKEKISFSQ